jgi:hypothetical protein
MAGRILNRRELRRQADVAEQTAPPETGEAPPEGDDKPKKAAKPKAAAKPRAPRKKKKESARLCARWGVFDNSMKQVAIFDFNQKAEAERKAADLAAKKNASFFLQIVKEAMPEPATSEEDA